MTFPVLTSDTPVMTEQGPCRMPLLASGEVSGFQVLGPYVQVLGWSPTGTYERCRGESAGSRTAVSSQTNSPLLGGNC